MTKHNKYSLYLLSALCITGVACTQDRQPCLTPKIASYNLRTVRVASYIDTTIVDTALPSAVFQPLTAIGTAGTLYPVQSAFTLSLSSNTDSCKWAFTTDTIARRYDTLSFYYDRKLQFVSNACGFAYFYQIKSVATTNHFIDSFHITNTSVTNNVNTSHLQVFIHPNF